MKRTEITYASLAEIDENRPELPEQVKEEVEIQVKYDGYIKLQEMQVEKFKKLEKSLEESSETFAVLNNKKKSLTRAQYIINVDFNEKEILEYNINRTATIINLNKGKLHLNNFDGYVINNIEINSENQKFDVKDLYVANIISAKQIQDIIESGKYKLIGNNGYIFQS